MTKPMPENFDNEEEEVVEKSEDRKKRSIRDIPLVKKSRNLEEKAEKEAIRDQTAAMKKVKRKVAKEGTDVSDDIPNIKHTLVLPESMQGESLEKLEAEEEAHYEEMKLRDAIEKKRKTRKKKSSDEEKETEIEPAFTVSDVKTKKNKPPRSFVQKLSIFAVCCLIVLFALGQTIFAKATVTISAPAQMVAIPETTLPNPIGYESFTKNTEKKVTVDDIKTVSVNKKATGTIILYNNFSTAPYDLIKTTRVQTKNGSVYRLTEDVVIPGKKVVGGKDVPGTVSAKVEAELPGSDYNAKGGLDLFLPGLIPGTAKYINIYAKTAANFTGGSTGTATDTSSGAIPDAVEKAKVDAEKEALDEFSKANPDKIILNDSVQTTTSLGPITTGSGQSSVTVRVTTKAIAVSANDIKAAIGTLLVDRKMVPVESSLGDLNYEVRETTGKALLDGTFNLSVKGDVTAIFAISPFDLKQLIAKRTIADANNVVMTEMPGADVEISLWPFWKKTLPASNKIEVKLN